MLEEKLVPKIRFSEFEEPWNEVQLKDIATFSKGKGISKEDITGNGIPCIRYGELYTQYKENITEVYSKTNLEKDNLVLSEKDDILIPCSGETAIDLATASCVRDEGVAIGGDITIIKTNQNPLFVSYCLNNKRTEIAKYAQGVSIVHLYAKDFKDMNLMIPKCSEQKKIVEFLENLNIYIDSLERKKSLFIKTKNSIIKSINDNILLNSPDVLISDLFRIKKGKGLSKEKVSEEGKYSAILYGELYTTYNEIIESTISFTDCNEGFHSKKGDILIPGSTTTKGIDLVTASVVCSDDIRLGGDINILRKKEEINPVYAATFIKYCMKREILRLTQGSTIIHLYGKDLKDLPIKLLSLEVQNNIANFIKYYNIQEKLYDKKINKFKDFKKGLLQKMFV